MNLKDKLHERVFVPTKSPSDTVVCESMEMGFSPITKVLESEPSYLLTPLELLELKKQWASEVFDASRDAEAQSWAGIDFKHPDKETYINSLTL